jgi:HAD domain in Swiss Army Knife RNA repair proteins
MGCQLEEKDLILKDLQQEKPFVIYLDIDGVLVSYMELHSWHEDGHHNFKQSAVDALNQLVAMFDAEICIVSSWVSFFKSDEDWLAFMRSRGIVVNSVTRGRSHNRPEFVIERQAEGYKRFLIIDDEALWYILKYKEIGYNRIIATNPLRCLDESDMLWTARQFSRISNPDYPKDPS